MLLIIVAKGITQSLRAVEQWNFFFFFFFFSPKSWDFCLVSGASAALTVKDCIQSSGAASTMPPGLNRQRSR